MAWRSFPSLTILTDRADGKLWLLTHDVTGEYVAINDQVSFIYIVAGPQLTYVIYPAAEGPVIPDAPTNPIGQKAKQKRLLVRGGFLGYEDIENEVETGRAMTRREMSRVLRRIVVPDSWRAFDSNSGFRDDDTLAYRFEDLP